jgi:HK97 family phage portal protein
MGFLDRIQHGWNAFMNKDPTYAYRNLGAGYTIRPDRPRVSRGNEKSIVTAVLNKIALDVANINIRHCDLDKNGRFVNERDSYLNECLKIEANIDQTARAFIHDAALSLLDEGSIAIVPVEATLNPMNTASFDIKSMRVGRILEWYPAHVRVRLYNEKTGEKDDVVVAKRMTAIVENPFFAVMNEPNSTLQRLIRKLNLLDVIDEQSGSGKLDLIIQLPYTIKTDARREYADRRRKDIEDQLKGPYGIAYVDGTERITQLNRPVENNLMKQIEYLTSMLYSQLGITQSILDGSADEQTMLNYYSRTIEPIISAIVDEMKRKFLTKTARTQGQSISFFRDPFKLVPINNIAEIADKFTRNEILTSNEIRQIIGMKPSDDPKADQLVNSNISQPNEEVTNPNEEVIEESEEGGKNQNGKV